MRDLALVILMIAMFGLFLIGCASVDEYEEIPEKPKKIPFYELTNSETKIA